MGFYSLALAAVTALLSLLSTVSAGALNIKTTAGIQATSLTLAQNLMAYFPAGAPAGVGVLPAPYYWWESGGVWGGMLDYWHYTGDAQFNGAVTAALVAQAGPGADFLGAQTDGNDDQGWWAVAAMSAAEYGLPVPAGGVSWLQMAQNVQAQMVARWDTTSCNGGLKWKITPGAPGYGYKNSVANGLFFQLSARLFRLTGEPAYGVWATTVFDWVHSVGLIDKQWNVYDGTDDTIACSAVDHDQWSYNAGLFVYGAAVMQAMWPGDPNWPTRTQGLINATAAHFLTPAAGSTSPARVMVEAACEPQSICDTDQLSFKAYLSRFLAATASLLPQLAPQIQPVLAASAAGATASCAAGPGASTCGMRWTIDAWDSTAGAGQQLAALEVVHGLLALGKPAPMLRTRRSSGGGMLATANRRREARREPRQQQQEEEVEVER